MNRQTTISRPQWLGLALLFILALVISLFSLYPEQVERYYSRGIYPAIGTTFRMITRWIPFSLGDVLYVSVIIFLLYKTVRACIHIYQKKYTKPRFLNLLYSAAKWILWVYIIFKLIWGLNYDRSGIAYQLHIEKIAYTKEQVRVLTSQLIDKVNECRRLIKDTVLPKPSLDSIYQEAFQCYQNVSYDLDFLDYTNRSVKSSLFSGIGDYLGFSGYYNPFTGEAQLRSDIPRTLIPYIACHEMAHQLGYASESEANFVGYLAASSSANPYFRYSVYNDLFSYAQGEEIFLYGKENDFKAFENVIQYNRSHLDTLVKKDRREIREFFNKHKNHISPAVSGLYDQYLKMNKQSKGIDSYNEVIGWLLSYQKEYGKI